MVSLPSPPQMVHRPLPVIRHWAAVVAVIALDVVIAVITVDRVLAGATVQLVVAVATVDVVVSVAGEDLSTPAPMS